MPAPKPANVDEYLAAAPEVGRAHLESIREIFRAAAPDAVESLKWSQPAYTAKRIVYCFAGYKDHANVMPTPGTIDEFRAEIEATPGLAATSGVLQIPYDVPFPADLVRRIAEHRAAAERAGAKYAV